MSRMTGQAWMTRWARAIAVIGLTACGAGAGNSADYGPAPAAPGGCELSQRSDAFVYPAGPYGVDVGDQFENFSLADCDGNEVWFDQLLMDAEAVLFNVGAGWCAPCVEETETIDPLIFQPLCGRGLRVVQVLYQDQDSAPATSLFCKRWRSKFGLSFPVLKDPQFLTRTFFEEAPASQTPLNLLIDKQGTIIERWVAAPPANLDQIISSHLPP